MKTLERETPGTALAGHAKAGDLHLSARVQGHGKEIEARLTEILLQSLISTAV